MSSNKNQEKPELEWIIKDMHSETFEEKFKRKFLENPFVPVGCFTTAGILMYGLWAFKTGDSKLSQQMMRYRILAQGLTIAAVVGGVMLTARHL